MRRAWLFTVVLASCLDPTADLNACRRSGRCEGSSDAGASTVDAGKPDAGRGVPDAGLRDAGGLDSGSPDAGSPDAAIADAGQPDADGGRDAGTIDPTDAGVSDAGARDAGLRDAGARDAGVDVDDEGRPCPGGRTKWLDAGILREWSLVAAEFALSRDAGRRADAGEVSVEIAPWVVPTPLDMYAGALAMDGTIISAPSDTQQFHQANPNTGLVTALTPTVGTANAGNYVGGVLGFDGLVYSTPGHENLRLARIDTSASVANVSLVGAPLDAGSANNSGMYGVVGLDGWLYAVPGKSALVGRIELSCPTHWEQLQGTRNMGIVRFDGAQLMADGGIVAIPSTEHEVMFLFNGASHSVPVPNNAMSAAWAGGVIALNQKIYGMPNAGGLVLEIDPQTLTVSTFDAGTGEAYAGGVLGPDGMIYAMPRSAPQVMVIDPNTRTTRFIGPQLNQNNVGSDLYKYWGGVLLPDGRIVAIPSTATKYLIIDPHPARPPSAAAVRSPWLNKY